MRIKKAKGPEPKALIDLDGTVADFDGAMRAKIEELFGKAAVDDPSGAWARLPDHTKSRIRHLIKQQPGFWLGLPPLQLGLKIYVELMKLGYSLTVLSKGPSHSMNAWTEKVQWCQKWLPEADVTITQDKGLVYGRVLVDDYPEYITDWLEWRPRGVVLMPGHPWNADFTHPQVFRVECASDVVRLLPRLRKAAR